jgi:heavy metal sensor kinase
MTLTTRLCGFFLAALALVLVGFCTALFLFSRSYLLRQVDERLEATVATLAAAAEVRRDAVEWEPHERQLQIGQDTGPDEVRWIILDGQGRLVDQSRNVATVSEHEPSLPSSWLNSLQPRSITHQGQTWRLMQRQVLPKTADRSSQQTNPGQRESRREGGHTALVLTAGISLTSVEAALFNLAAALVGLSFVIWLVAAVLGRSLCRRALRPLSQMATAAQSLTAAEPGGRLPRPNTADELDQLCVAFNDLLGRLHDALERQRRFTGDASHQLRTPLTALCGQIEVALRRDRSAEDYREVLALVQRRADQLRKIVEMLLFLARADAEARLPHLEAIDLSSWLPRHLVPWSDHARAADLRVVMPPAPAYTAVHPALFGQLVDNLVDNAFKYSPPGTPVTVRLGSGSQGLALTVEDAGQGIAAQELTLIFEPFHRSPAAIGLGQAGLGLGLAVAKRIAQAHGGHIEVQSEPGHGSRFVVTLTQLSMVAPSSVFSGRPSG